MSRKRLAASYVRMSTDRQETSPIQQREAIAKLAEQMDYDIICEYQDSGISGDSTGKRAGFQKMIADGSTRKFDSILCWDQDRFGRFDLIEAGRWIDPLRNAGVTLVTVTAGLIDWVSLTGQLGFMAHQMGKAQYLRDLSQNIRRGQDRLESQGRWARGFAPFGYRVDQATGKLVPGDPKTVRILQSIFEKYAGGMSQREVCFWLQAQGIKTSHGKDFQPQSLRHILRNIAYRGHIAYGKSSASKYLPQGTPSGKRRYVDEEGWRIQYGVHEPLVSQELFDECQLRREENKVLTGPKAANRYALSAFIQCAHCGGRMVGTSSKDGVKRYVCCSYTYAKGTCGRRSIKEQEVLTIVLAKIRQEFIDKHFSAEDRSLIREQMRALLLSNEQDHTAQREEIQKRAAELDGELEQAVNAMLVTSEDLRPLVEKRVRQIQDERDKLQDSLSVSAQPAAEQIQRAESRIDAAIKWLDQIEEVAKTDYDPFAMREMLRQFIERIEVAVERIPQGKRSKYALSGGKIYFRADAFPAWAVAQCAELASRQERNCLLYTLGDSIVIEFSLAI